MENIREILDKLIKVMISTDLVQIMKKDRS